MLKSAEANQIHANGEQERREQGHILILQSDIFTRIMKFQTLPLLDEGTLARSFFKGCAARDIFGLSLFSTTSSALDHSATEPPPPFLSQPKVQQGNFLRHYEWRGHTC